MEKAEAEVSEGFVHFRFMLGTDATGVAYSPSLKQQSAAGGQFIAFFKVRAGIVRLVTQSVCARRITSGWLIRLVLLQRVRHCLVARHSPPI